MNLLRLIAVYTILIITALTNITLGQDILTLFNGGRINIKSGTTFQSTDLNIGAGCQLSNRGNLTVNGILANYAGTSGLILQADESGYGSLLHTTNMAPASVEQYLTSERWHLITPPVQGATIGLYENTYLKQWHENTVAWEYLVTPLTMPMNMNQGYAVWAADELTGPKTIVFEGSTRAGNTAFTGLSYTTGTGQDGWNLVGNPYPSPVEWNTDWTLSNVGGWAIVYENGIFKGWNPWMPAGEQSFNGKTDGFIAPTQGFWIRATGASPYVSIPQSARAHSSVNFLKDDLDSDALSLHISVTANEYTDETAVIFMEGAETAFDPLYDLEKHMNVAESPNIYSIPQTGKTYAINVLPADWIENTAPSIIPIGFAIEPMSTCILNVSGIEEFDPSVPIYLEDLKEGTLQNLSESSVYEFFASVEDDPNRFLLHFGQPAIANENTELECKIYAWEHNVYVQLPQNIKANVLIHDYMGRLVAKRNLNSSLSKIWLNKGGQYIVTIATQGMIKTQKIYIGY